MENQAIEDGFQGITSRLDLAPGIREFLQFKDGLSTVDGVILYNNNPPLAAQEPVYPFQCICADYFKYKGCNYMVVVDRYFGWPIVQQSRHGSSGFV